MPSGNVQTLHTLSAKKCCSRAQLAQSRLAVLESLIPWSGPVVIMLDLNDHEEHLPVDEFVAIVLNANCN